MSDWSYRLLNWSYVFQNGHADAIFCGSGSIIRKILVSLFKYKLSVIHVVAFDNDRVYPRLFTSAVSEAAILVKFKPKTPETTN